MSNEERNEVYAEIIQDLKKNAKALELVSMDEQMAFDNLQEHFPDSQRVMDMEDGLMNLDDAMNEIDDIISALEGMVEG